ncbi:MAG: NTP transferase domain-containing protein, partial [Elusimicrobia bacterium]|nr:NTP transferase domain-containing protein [Elusimicrobiota bacterium]
LGTRMKSNLPKILHPVAGKPMILRVLDAANSLKPKATAVMLGHQSEKIKPVLKNRAQILTQKKLLGSGQAVLEAAAFIRKFDQIVILCGDAPLITGQTVKNFLAEFNKSGCEGAVITACVPDPKSYGRIVRDGRFIEKIVEQLDAGAQYSSINEINSGMYVFKSRALLSVLNKLPKNKIKNEYYLTDTVSLLRKKGLKILAHKIDDWQETLGVNSRVELALAEKIIYLRNAEKLMLSGVTITDPHNTYIEDSVSVGKDTIIYPFTMILSESEIGSNCKIGPFAHLRPGSKIKDGAKIGNFTEVKASVIGKGSKVPHLSYVGDCEIGEKVNVGAGTITCNYDGVKKHKTVIGDGAFIGSNVNLVAPVKVGAGAKIGAGSTITDNVPKRTLAIARSRQVIKKLK